MDDHQQATEEYSEINELVVDVVNSVLWNQNAMLTRPRYFQVLIFYYLFCVF